MRIKTFKDDTGTGGWKYRSKNPWGRGYRWEVKMKQ